MKLLHTSWHISRTLYGRKSYEEFGAFLNWLVDLVEAEKIELHSAKKSALQDIFKTMLNKLITGEIRVKDLDIDVSEVSV